MDGEVDDFFGGLNLGTGKGFSLRDIISEIKCFVTRSITCDEASRRPDDPVCLIADASAADEWLWRHRHFDMGTAWCRFANEWARISTL